MSFTAYDLTLLGIFVVFVFSFLYIKRKNLKKQGWLFLYRTEWGIKLINKVGNKYQKTLKFFSYISIILGYFLMIGIVYMLGRIVWLYVLHPSVVKAIKVPPITPLIPYLPQIFKLDFLPPFYFTYWIIIIAVIAITHEFSHGIFAAYSKVKIKKTGFGFFPFFLPIFLAAFVELDEKRMAKKPKFNQMAILSAGTLANTITAILFLAVLWIFFTAVFVPSGIVFDDYSYTVVSITAITSINNVSVQNPTIEKISELTENKSFNEIEIENRKFIAIKAISEDKTKIALYDDSPAINAKLSGAILEINSFKIYGIDKLSEELNKYSPGEKVMIKTKTGNEIKTQEITLEENPFNKGKAWLGVGFIDLKSGGIINKIFGILTSFKESHVYYESKVEIGEFIYDLLWWLIIISISVALVNMLPVGIFDGGRFFYLTVLGITKSEEKAKKTFSLVTYLFLLLVAVLMFFWLKNIF